MAEQPDFSARSIPAFIDAVHALLELIVRPGSPIRIANDFREDVERAWAEYRDMPFKAGKLNDEDLRKVGLHEGSAQLQLKLSLVEWVWDKFKDSVNDWIDDLLDSINNVLDSIPGAEILAEIKTAIHEAIKLSRRSWT